MSRARLLDVTRLTSRAGLKPTGVDRVEFAYLDGFVRDSSAEPFGLCRTALGFVLMDRAGLIALRDAIEAGPFLPPDILSRWNARLSPAARRGQSFARRHAAARARPRALGQLLGRLPRGFVYFNVGHSNLTGRVFRAMNEAGASDIAVLIHDTIPLDWPDMQRPGTVPRFRKMLTVATRHATVLICSTRAVAADIGRHTGTTPNAPRRVIAPLGIAPLTPTPEALAPGAIPLRPFFVVLGTIEPRKNHALLLDIWEDWGPGAPELLILGRRGWRNEEVFARLDAGIPHVVEHADLSDGAIAALLERAQGLLFPSFAEGYGLPPAEAAGLGVPVVCADLAACREVMQDWPVYADPTDRYAWETQIRRLSRAPDPHRRSPMTLPDWDAHLRTVLASIGQDEPVQQ
ncbi:glycosyltransferase family 1 protein [Salipiger sp. IMCC34102]|uniref:glycosyltransferase n=1 Tax=Salipiger sp. IMCC34102 TaxID=2510647 RepID=UPI00101D45F7|nr:glycosyltransferase [Salipiger sp. IMCC34102]RYH04157.1 glycosyltransferase family 1 protein [Salipiger sp. IMCC34102]